MQKIIPNLQKYIIPHISEQKIRNLHRELLIDSSWTSNYVVLTISACLIATFGLISNSTAVIIGAMLVAPLMMPLRGLAFSALEGNIKLFSRAIISLIGATILAVTLSCIIGKIAGLPQFGSELLARTQPTLIDLGIAVAAGGISAFAKIRKGISDVLAGTAIAVALMPPLCAVGLSLSQGFYTFAQGAFLLYLTNFLGIVLACMLVFIVAGYAKVNHALGWTLGLTAILLIPLGTSFVQLVKQEKIKSQITHKLINETITIGHNAQNTIIDIDWTNKPAIIYIYLQTDQEITPHQVGLVENFISNKMGNRFTVVFEVSALKQITSQEININKDQIPPSFPKTSPIILNKQPKN